MTPIERYAVISRLPPDLPLALMDLLIGIVYLIGAPGRSSSPAFRVAKELMPIWLWGIYFATVGVWLLVIVLWSWTHPVRRRPSHGVLALRIASAALFAMWAIMFGLSGLTDRYAELGGIPVYLFLSYRHSFAPAGR